MEKKYQLKALQALLKDGQENVLPAIQDDLYEPEYIDQYQKTWKEAEQVEKNPESQEAIDKAVFNIQEVAAKLRFRTDKKTLKRILDRAKQK